MSRTLEYRGRYKGTYRVRMSSYGGPDFSRICFVFPGQAAAFPGMFAELVANDPVVARLYERADRLARDRGIPSVSAYSLEPESVPALHRASIHNLERPRLLVG